MAQRETVFTAFVELYCKAIRSGDTKAAEFWAGCAKTFCY